MESSNILSLQGFSHACSDCRLQNLCLPAGIPREELGRLDRIVNHRRRLRRGAALYAQNARLGSLFVVRSGSLKSRCFTEDGRDQILGFHLPGDILGLDAISDSRHPTSAVALETSAICELPFTRLHALAHELESLQRQLLRIVSRELCADNRFARMIANRDAEGRVAGFLLDLGTRYSIRGYSSTDFNLSMTRSDMARYLGLAVETVSRTFTRFQQDGLITAQGKTVKILQLRLLGEVAGSTASIGFTSAKQGR